MRAVAVAIPQGLSMGPDGVIPFAAAVATNGFQSRTSHGEHVPHGDDEAAPDTGALSSTEAPRSLHRARRNRTGRCLPDSRSQRTTPQRDLAVRPARDVESLLG